MPAYILTGAPGAGKTAILRLLEANGYPVVEEAATDVIPTQATNHQAAATRAGANYRESA